MKDEIYIELNKNLSLPTVMPKNKPKNNYLTTTILLKGWNLSVYYSEDKQQKIRFVEDIEFNKRQSAFIFLYYKLLAITVWN